jgi:5'-3' exonuclease
MHKRAIVFRRMNVHLIDGTYELFRHFYALPRAADLEGREIGAVRGVLTSIVGLLGEGATHLGVATDHVIESFRNELYAGYKTGDGIEPALRSQFEPLEAALELLGVRVWPMVSSEADDALASAAARASEDPAVERIFICTPDKDLAQSVRGTRVVQLDRRTGEVRDEAGVRKKFGVGPESIPDYLALVGDSADGFPGLAGWGARSAATVLARYRHLDGIPADASDWDVSVRGAARLAGTLARQGEAARLFRRLATLLTDLPVFDSIEELRWRGPRPEFENYCASIRAERLRERAGALVEEGRPDT